jgi:hypothetical protein
LRLIASICLLLAMLPAALADNKPGDPGVQDVHALLLEVEAHQKQIEKIREDYTYRAQTRVDDLSSDGKIKKTETGEFEVFFANGHPIQRQVKKDGKDLSPDEMKKEQNRVNKEVEEAMKKSPDQPMHGDAISVQRLLEIISIHNPRRINYKDRPTVVFDFVGDPHTKTHGMTEDISKKLSGTVWIDEKDRQVTRMDAHIDDTFRMGGGLVASVQKGSSFTFEQGLVNHELWLPTAADIHYSARVLLVKGMRQNVHIVNDHYQKFSADAQQQSGVTVKTPAKP